MTNKTSEALLKENNRLLRALLALYVETYLHTATNSEQKVELLLAARGLDYKDIAQALGKKPDAVRMLLKRNNEVIKNIQNN